MATARSGVFHPTTRPWPWSGSARRWSPRTRRIVLAVAIVLAMLWLASRAFDEPLRHQLERRVNASLTGYTATIGHAHVRFLGLGLDLRDVTVVQNSLPNPPVIYIPSWKTTVQWRALFSGALVGDVSFTRPAIYVTLPQAQVEAKDPTPTADHGWQQAVESIYPLKINLFKIDDGTLDYWDTGDLPPVRLRRFSVRAENIRNARSVAGKYPSPFELEAVMADGADLTFRGRADFLATPHATLRGSMGLRDLVLTSLKPALRHMNLDVERGKLAARGEVEYTPKQLRLALERVSLESAKIDYVIRSEEDVEKVGKAAKATTTAKAQAENRVDVKEAVVGKSTFGIVNRTAKPPYRLYVADTDIRVTNFSNQRDARRGAATMRGRFMGTGPLQVDADFAPGAKSADFRVKARVEDVDLAAMNDVLRAQADVDVTKGRLSIFSDVTVRDGRVNGYVKPLFSDVDVYDSKQDAGKNPLHQVYEAAIGAASTVLTNRPRDEVATITDLSGPVESPSTSTWDMVIGLLRNAFVKAIMPGLEPKRQ